MRLPAARPRSARPWWARSWGLTTLLRVKNKWVGGRRGADVRATTPMKVVVMTADQMQWILEHDYGADGEMTKTIKKRAEELRRKSLDNGIVHA